MLKSEKESELSLTELTFEALVAAVIPETSDLTGKQDHFQSYGALECNLHEYQIWSLDHSLSQTILKVGINVHLAKPTAKMLNIAAKQLINNAGNKEPINSLILCQGKEFVALSPSDRLRAIALLEQLKVNSLSLPLPFWNNPGLVLSIIGTIMMFSTIGYYSGWSGYGSSSLETPEKREVEDFPICWKQTGYPGPSKGYHSLRGYLIEKFME